VTLPELEKCLGELLKKRKRVTTWACARAGRSKAAQGATDKTLALLKDLARA